MTVDEDEEGVTLAFCICDSESTSTMQTFFATVRKKVGLKIKAEYFLTDDANAFFNAWCLEMTTEIKPHKRLCAWHVNKNWNTHFSQVPNVPLVPKELNKTGKPITKRSRCKSILYSLLQELDLNVFNSKMTKFLNFMDKDTDYHKFRDYFKKTYANRSEQWAYAYLPKYGGYNTNMYLEAWHSVFKRHYLNGVYQQRLDFVLHQLIQYDKDELEEETRRQIFGRRRNKRSAKVLKSHKLAHQQLKENVYTIECIPSEDGQPQYFFHNDKTSVVVSLMPVDPLHKCIYM